MLLTYAIGTAVGHVACTVSADRPERPRAQRSPFGIIAVAAASLGERWSIVDRLVADTKVNRTPAIRSLWRFGSVNPARLQANGARR
jgi:hypothetical protein